MGASSSFSLRVQAAIQWLRGDLDLVRRGPEQEYGRVAHVAMSPERHASDARIDLGCASHGGCAGGEARGTRRQADQG